MSYTFSRRAFLKYSAAAAVAVAGAGLLGGCQTQDPNNPKRTDFGKTSIMQITANLESFDMTTGAFRLSLLSARANPIRFTADDISVTILDEDGKAVTYYNGYPDLDFTVESGFAHAPYLEQKDEASFSFTINDFTAVQPGQTVKLQYIPVSDYPSYSMIWEIKNPAEEASSSDTTTDPDTGSGEDNTDTTE